jgi:hypothetical protein
MGGWRREVEQLEKSLTQVATEAEKLGATLDEYGWYYELPNDADDARKQKLRQLFSSETLLKEYGIRSYQDWIERGKIFELSKELRFCRQDQQSEPESACSLRATPDSSAGASCSSGCGGCLSKYNATGFENLPKIMAVDVARFGDDRSIIGISARPPISHSGQMSRLGSGTTRRQVLEQIDKEETGLNSYRWRWLRCRAWWT